MATTIGHVRFKPTCVYDDACGIIAVDAVTRTVMFFVYVQRVRVVFSIALSVCAPDGQLAKACAWVCRDTDIREQLPNMLL